MEDKLLEFVNDESEKKILKFYELFNKANIKVRRLVKQDPLGNIMFIYFGLVNFKAGYYLVISSVGKKEVIFHDRLDSYGVAMALKELEEHGC